MPLLRSRKNIPSRYCYIDEEEAALPEFSYHDAYDNHITEEEWLRLAQQEVEHEANGTLHIMYPDLYPAPAGEKSPRDEMKKKKIDLKVYVNQGCHGEILADVTKKHHCYNTVNGAGLELNSLPEKCAAAVYSDLNCQGSAQLDIDNGAQPGCFDSINFSSVLPFDGGAISDSMDNTADGSADAGGSRKRRAAPQDAPNRRKRQVHTRSLPLESYLVGWIVALEDELTAALAMLDERHAQPEYFEQPQNDTNAYHWGHIGAGLNCHNIVIASLPGIYGTASAATTAKELSISHPHVRFGLLVGIGAGVPRPEHDVRLGDIVVSRPLGTTGGVIQYDLVKAKATGSELAGHLAAPPAALQKAAMSLASQHALDESDIPGIIEDVFEKHPKLAKSGQWAYPKTERDRLSAETYLRSGVDFSLAEDCRDPEGDVVREARETWCPEIHFGAIGSGDTLVKDVAQREIILKRLPAECLCLEMEAAGLMNAFPCLVIRGICDYGDSRKNDKWQKYAALAAAAYAKELLDSMKAREVSRAPRAMIALKDQSQ
ncbi:hypothetical protein PRZ48_010456 [Zasmidium cellare]|uniref:Nucleoside phosphorylase domain-containing protein n=1 Tax=Zasmidium cellare TaxID=395010 RepID=A0ABR0E8P5_ZASCE|nr:hypothetical protein PRZ48_010456 [Zasmidium cellare]